MHYQWAKNGHSHRLDRNFVSRRGNGVTKLVNDDRDEDGDEVVREMGDWEIPPWQDWLNSQVRWVTIALFEITRILLLYPHVRVWIWAQLLMVQL